MKSLKMICKLCNKSLVLVGSNTTEIIKKLDASGWVDEPDRIKGIVYTCPDCNKQIN